MGLTKGRRDLAQHSQQRRSKLWSQSLRKTNIYLSLKGCNFQNNWNWQKLRWNIIHISTTRIKFVKWNCRHKLCFMQIVKLSFSNAFCQLHFFVKDTKMIHFVCQIHFIKWIYMHDAKMYILLKCTFLHHAYKFTW